MVFQDKNLLKRAYEFFANPKVQFNKLTPPHWEKTAINAQSLKILLAVGDTTFLDYNNIKAKTEGYGPIGNGGNGLILHSTLAVEPEQGQPLGLLWQKLWHREAKAKPPADETPAQKKARQLAEQKANRNRPFESKESYRWVEAMKAVQAQLQKVEKHLQETKQQRPENLEPIGSRLRIVHVFDREGDIAEVFERVHQSERTGVVVRAAHNRSLNTNITHLWEHLSAQPIQFEHSC